MKIWILHDSRFGNGEKLAEQLAEVFKKKSFEVKIGHVKAVKPAQVAQEAPEGLIIGAALRMLMASPASKRWLRKFNREQKKRQQTVNFGCCFLTHLWKKEQCTLQGKRLVKALQKATTIKKVFPEWLSGRVVKAKGPLTKETITTIQEFGEKVLSWIK
ncbi:MAG: hypothetical protein K9W42_12605 [Candidatus Heimdallarchaeota archaeon]|nr:hypothetical protein [Candidatus Heimdallarchaeota archaeon]